MIVEHHNGHTTITIDEQRAVDICSDANRTSVSIHDLQDHRQSSLVTLDNESLQALVDDLSQRLADQRLSEQVDDRVFTVTAIGESTITVRRTNSVDDLAPSDSFCTVLVMSGDVDVTVYLTLDQIRALVRRLRADETGCVGDDPHGTIATASGPELTTSMAFSRYGHTVVVVLHPEDLDHMYQSLVKLTTAQPA